MEILTGEELKIIDGVIDYWDRAGVPLSGVNFDNPIVMGGLKKFFRKIGKGIKNVAQKIKQRIRERNLQANVQTDQGFYSLGPQGVTAVTPNMSLTTDRAVTPERFLQKDESLPIQDKEGKQPPYLMIGGVLALALIVVMMGKK